MTRQSDAIALLVSLQRTKMVAKFLWIFPVLVAVAFARSIWVRDSDSLDVLNGEQMEIEPYIFENKMLEAIHKLKSLLKYGDPENGVPPIDPFFLLYKEFDFILRDTTLSGYLQNVTFTNFSRFEPDVIQLKLMPLHFKLELGIDKFQIDGSYNFLGKVLDAPVDGVGQFMSEIGNLTLCLYLRLSTVNNSFQIKDFIFEFTTLKVKVNYTNELDGDQFRVLDEDLVLHVLDQVQDDYVPPLLTTAKILLNRFLLGYSVADVLNFILNFLQKEREPASPQPDY